MNSLQFSNENSNVVIQPRSVHTVIALYVFYVNCVVTVYSVIMFTFRSNGSITNTTLRVASYCHCHCSGGDNFWYSHNYCVVLVEEEAQSRTTECHCRV